MFRVPLTSEHSRVISKKIGPLILDRSIGCLAGKAAWNRQSLNHKCHVDDSLDLTAPLQLAEWHWSDQVACNLRVENLPFLRIGTDAIH